MCFCARYVMKADMRLDVDVLREVLLYLENELHVEHIDGRIISNSVNPFEIKSDNYKATLTKYGFSSFP